MTAILQSAPLAQDYAENVIRNSVLRRDSKALYIHECATSWITALIRDPNDRPAEEVLADVTTICEALAEVDFAFFSCEGTG